MFNLSFHDFAYLSSSFPYCHTHTLCFWIVLLVYPSLNFYNFCDDIYCVSITSLHDLVPLISFSRIHLIMNPLGACWWTSSSSKSPLNSLLQHVLMIKSMGNLVLMFWLQPFTLMVMKGTLGMRCNFLSSLISKIASFFRTVTCV